MGRQNSIAWQAYQAALAAHREIETLPDGHDEPVAQEIYRKHNLSHLAEGMARRRAKGPVRNKAKRIAPGCLIPRAENVQGMPGKLESGSHR